MIKFPRILIAATLCGSVFLSALDVSAYSVAVLPIADLTEGRGGVDFKLTDQLIDQLRRQGLDIIEPSRVIDFMVQESLRHGDEIDSFLCRKMAINLDCDSVLLTTLYRQSETAEQSNLILTLLHGKNGQPVWNKIISGHLNDFQPLFGIGTRREISVLQEQQIEEVSRQLIRDLPVLPEVHSADLLSVQIAYIQLTPPLVRGETSVHCRLKINFIGAEPELLTLTGGQNPITLQQSNIPDVYTGTLVSKKEEGNQSVSLSLRWSEQKEKTLTDLSSYQVANHPVLLSLNFLNSFQKGDIQVFSHEIKIVPRIKPRRPLELWRITMYDEQGNIVFSETQYTSLPKEMRWQGTSRNHQRLATGHYKLTLVVRDIAGNEAEITSKLYLQSTDTEMAEIKQQVENGSPRLNLLPSAALLVPIDHWILTLETENGDPLLTRKGTRLPMTIVIPAEIAQQNPTCHLLIQDRLGNHYSAAETRLENGKKGKALVQFQPKSNWKADF